jgi:hypothetical protein
MKRLMVALLVVAASGVLVVACGTSDTGDGAAGECTPGEELFCRCRGGIEGTKTCQSDGASFGECTTIDGECPEIPEDDDDGEDEDGEDEDGDPPLCFPGSSVPCTCDDGSAGNQICDATGQAYGECTTEAGVCGAGTTAQSGSTTGGGGDGTSKLFEACVDNTECKSGACLMGFCTRECDTWQNCLDDGGIQGECAAFAGGSFLLCAPYCGVQSDCLAAYGDPSACGFGVAPDEPSVGFTVCGDWGEDLQPVPGDGSIECEADVDCHLDIPGAQRICFFFGEDGTCQEGCLEPDHCPDGLVCDSAGSDDPGTCG